MMRCALAALESTNQDTEKNLQVILDTMQRFAGKADLILFGEAFLQGFGSADFDPDHDSRIAIALDDPIIIRLRDAARHHGVAVSFGFIERDGPFFYSTQLTIDASGGIADLFRRVSPGWKLPHAGDRYREGSGFHTFSFLGKRIAVGLCGDLWCDEHIAALHSLAPDVVLWPVYTDYTPQEWASQARQEYAEQAGRLNADVLYVNSVCSERDAEEAAHGGAAHFCAGRIVAEIPCGVADLLLVNLQ